MAGNFVINKDQISRLKVFMDYCRKMEMISPIEDTQVFVVNGTKLNVYGKGKTSAQIDATFDITSSSIVPKTLNYFSVEVQKLINYLEKTKDEEISVQFDDSSVTVKGMKTRPKYVQLTPTGKSQDEVDEIAAFIKDTITNEFGKAITFDLSVYRDTLTELANMTKLCDVNQQIQVNRESIKVADNMNIFQMTVPTDAIVNKDGIYIYRDVTSLFKNVDQFDISHDHKWFYFNVATAGIQILFVPKSAEWQYPEDSDLGDFVPLQKQRIKLEINTKEFFDVISNFDGVFDSGSWRYKQVFIKTPSNFKDELELSYDNMANQVFDTLKVKVLENTEKGKGFEFIFPTLHFNSLKSLLEKEETFNFEYNSIEIGQANGSGTLVTNGEINCIIAKMLPPS
jgi:hypothetical protein